MILPHPVIGGDVGGIFRSVDLSAGVNDLTHS